MPLPPLAAFSGTFLKLFLGWELSPWPVLRHLFYPWRGDGRCGLLLLRGILDRQAEVQPRPPLRGLCTASRPHRARGRPSPLQAQNVFSGDVISGLRDETNFTVIINPSGVVMWYLYPIKNLEMPQ